MAVRKQRANFPTWLTRADFKPTQRISLSSNYKQKSLHKGNQIIFHIKKIIAKLLPPWKLSQVSWVQALDMFKKVRGQPTWNKLRCRWPARWKCWIPHTLVKTKQRSVAERIMSCCDKADCDFCIARCKSLNMFSSEYLASQQFRNTGIKICRNLGTKIWNVEFINAVDFNMCILE